MSKATPKLANSVIGLSMLAMFTVAIVAGQTRVTPDADAEMLAETPQTVQLSRQASASLTLPIQELRRLEALPVIVNTLLDLPIHIDINMESGQITASPRSPLEGHFLATLCHREAHDPVQTDGGEKQRCGAEDREQRSEQRESAMITFLCLDTPCLPMWVAYPRSWPGYITPA